MTLNLRNNTTWAVIEVIVNGALILFLYKIMLREVGLDAFGVWSIVAAATSLIRMADPGTSTGLGRYVAVAHGRGNHRLVGAYLIVALSASVAFYGLICVLIYIPLQRVLGLILARHDLGLARELLPYSIAAFCTMNVSFAILGVLSGLQRSDIKSKIGIVGSVILVVMAAVLVPRTGIVGLALAQIIQYSLTGGIALIACWRLLKVKLTDLFAEMSYTERVTELWSFGLKLQFLSILSYVFDPLCKFVLSSVYGVSTVAIYELSQKFIVQARQIVVGPSSVLLPAFAHVSQNLPSQIGVLFAKSQAATVVSGVVVLGAAISISPAFSYWWLGKLNAEFLYFVVIFGSAWMINIAGACPYMLAIGRGKLKWNILGHMFALACVPVAFAAKWTDMSAVWSVLFLSSALASGSAITTVLNCREDRLSWIPNWRDCRDFVVDGLASLRGLHR